MITLPKISVVPEGDIAGLAVSDKSAPLGESFLALLSQAMPGLGDGKSLDLDALANGTQKLTLKPGEIAGEADTDAKTLLEAMLAGLHTPTDSQPDATATAVASVADKIHGVKDDKSLNEQDMAALTALFAMLPHQQTAALAKESVSGQANTAAVATATGSLAKSLTGDVRAEIKSDGKPRADTQALTAQAQPTASVATQQPDAVQAASNAEKLFNDANASSPTTPSALQPLVSSATTSTAPSSAAMATPHTAVLNAQLGTAEWQQAFSQHVTLMTRNGQQSAELRLNPEDLGQVHISLKIDDNLAQMQFVSPHSHVRAALEAALPTLRTQLAESGIQLGQSDISSESFAGQQQQQGQPQQGGSRGSQFSIAGSGEESVAAPASLQRIARGDNAVDIFA
ncbi:flagellar hook-length control protein FliK [Atlantibacter subterranea]|uniref:flagellar hook-length control protein FliK n=1 Tax=Atlantibacter subterraneus TaxID=255519 RepID=UPI00118297CF|nr:flagellar hook-length control protein FliK [Atlantibacter subterranea]TSJ59228.1 flagellar hook-length control protein FliK [Atlantibacter subterranea]